MVMKQGRSRVSIQPKMDVVAEAVALVRKLGAERQVGFNDGSLPYMSEVKRLALSSRSSGIAGRIRTSTTTFGSPACAGSRVWSCMSAA